MSHYSAYLTSGARQRKATIDDYARSTQSLRTALTLANPHTTSAATVTYEARIRGLDLSAFVNDFNRGVVDGESDEAVIARYAIAYRVKTTEPAVFQRTTAPAMVSYAQSVHKNHAAIYREPNTMIRPRPQAASRRPSLLERMVDGVKSLFGRRLAYA